MEMVTKKKKKNKKNEILHGVNTVIIKNVHLFFYASKVTVTETETE